MQSAHLLGGSGRQGEITLFFSAGERILLGCSWHSGSYLSGPGAGLIGGQTVGQVGRGERSGIVVG